MEEAERALPTRPRLAVPGPDAGIQGRPCGERREQLRATSWLVRRFLIDPRVREGWGRSTLPPA